MKKIALIALALAGTTACRLTTEPLEERNINVKCSTRRGVDTEVFLKTWRATESRMGVPASFLVDLREGDMFRVWAGREPRMVPVPQQIVLTGVSTYTIDICKY